MAFHMATNIRHRGDQSAAAALTHRELEVFRLVGKGHGNRQIAAELQISVRTVESYRARLKQKLSVWSSHELLERAAAWVVGETDSGNPRQKL